MNGEHHILIEDFSTSPNLSDEGIQEPLISRSQDVKEKGDNSGEMSDKDQYFKGTKKLVDYVLVHEDNAILTIGPTLQEIKERAHREHFFKNLTKAGLEMEEEIVQRDKTTLFFTKLHGPWDVMTFFAEELSTRAPIEEAYKPFSNASEVILKSLHLYNIMQQDVPNMPKKYFGCAFRRSKMHKYIGIEDQNSFFKRRERSRIVYEILATASYGKRKWAEIGIDRLIKENIFAGAYPLHDGTEKTPKNVADPSSLNRRQILRLYWARWGHWFKYQPVDHIRDYFGERIGMYFAWLGFYTSWLLPAAIIGVLVFSYGIATISYNVPAMEACNPSNDFHMCPLCDEDFGCAYWQLSDVCVFIKVSYLFDHPGTVFYAIFMSFWVFQYSNNSVNATLTFAAVTFLEYWKRKSVSLAYRWECLGFEDDEERPRPDYAAMAPVFERNPITGITEPYFPPRKRLPRLFSGLIVIVIMMFLAIIFIIAVIMYRVLVTIPLFKNDNTRAHTTTITSISSAFINLILIISLGKIYDKIALKMTQWEMHRTQTEFDNQLTFKVFLFQFVNIYGSIFYIGFFKGNFVGYPGNYTTLFGLRNEQCSNGGCLIELAQQLAVIMIGKQIINNIYELSLPKLLGLFRKHVKKETKGLGLKSQWEKDFKLQVFEGLFQEYIEMVIQFGFITIFVAAFPLAPLFALFNNWVEIRLDAQKLTCWTRRPIAERCEDIGVWIKILDAIAQFAVISNAFLIAFTSDFLPRLLYQFKFDGDLIGFTNFTLAYSKPGVMKHQCRYEAFRDITGTYTPFYWNLLTVRLAFIILFEHIVFGMNRLIDLVVPDVPEALKTRIKRERHLAKQSLADTDVAIHLDSDVVS